MHYANGSEICEVLISNAGEIGYSDVATIRHAVFQPGAGAVDVAMFPAEGSHRLVLIEVEMTPDTNASDSAVGRLMKYYSHALLLSVEGLGAYRKYALEHREHARGKHWTSPTMVLDEPDGDDVAWCELKHGRRLRPKEIALFVAFYGEVSPVLRQIITVLRLHHNLRIGGIRINDDGTVDVFDGAHLTNRMEP